jgi:hypothetical protein
MHPTSLAGKIVEILPTTVQKILACTQLNTLVLYRPMSESKHNPLPKVRKDFAYPTQSEITNLILFFKNLPSILF